MANDANNMDDEIMRDIDTGQMDDSADTIDMTERDDNKAM